MRILLFATLCLLLVPFTSSARTVGLPPQEEPVQVKPLEKKRLVSASYGESVQIAGIRYLVPRQWRGRKVSAPTLQYEDFSRIPRDFTHKQGELYLRKEAAAALQDMAEKAQEDNVFLQVHSAYRSVGYQKRIFKKYLEQGRTFDDIVRYVAPPGYSQHALGTVVDFYPSNWEFAATEAYAWLKNHAGDFHFIESYPEHQPAGYPWEAWHWRWLPESERY